MLNLYELARVINEPLVVTVGNNGFGITFKNSEFKKYKNDCLAGSEWGSGPTIDHAADNYFQKINGGWLVFDGRDKDRRREYSAEIAGQTNKS